MAIPVTKEQLIQAIETNFQKLQKELSDISEEDSEEQEMPGHAQGTLMSIKNLVSYLLGWGELVLKWEHKKSNDEPIEFPETGYRWNELGKLAHKLYKEYSSIDFNTLKIKLKINNQQILALVHSKTNTELYELPWYEKWTLGRMIQLNTSSPYSNARTRIRQWKKNRNNIEQNG